MKTSTGHMGLTQLEVNSETGDGDPYFPPLFCCPLQRDTLTTTILLQEFLVQTRLDSLPELPVELIRSRAILPAAEADCSAMIKLIHDAPFQQYSSLRAMRLAKRRSLSAPTVTFPLSPHIELVEPLVDAISLPHLSWDDENDSNDHGDTSTTGSNW